MNHRFGVILATSLLGTAAVAAARNPELGLSEAFAETQQAVEHVLAQHAFPPAAPVWGDSTVDAELQGAGVAGLIHASVADRNIWVLLVWAPGDFFTSHRYPLRPADEQIAAKMRALRLERHDLVRVKGRLASDPPHIDVSDIELLDTDPVDFSHQATDFPQALGLPASAETEIEALVHAVLREGHQVLLEYKGNILPLTLQDPADAAAAQALDDLGRGDAIRVRATLRSRPNRPPHLVFSGAPNVIVLERARDFQGQAVELEGPLVLFAHSPITTRDVWAVQVKSKVADVVRTFTINNFADIQAWDAIDAKLARAWKDAAPGVIQARNKFINPGLIVRIKGVVADAAGGHARLAQNQANQTVTVAGPGDVTVRSVP